MLTIHPAEHHQLWPLHQESSCSDQLIAGTTLLVQQQRQAGSISDSHQLENAWVTRNDWEKLAQSTTPAVLESAAGDTLAWIGEHSIPSGKVIVIASEESFLIRHPWQFLDINAQMVSALTEPNHLGTVSPAAHFDGVVHVGEGSQILPGVVIEGNAVIGKNCKIGPNCYLRGATTIGDGCHIGQAVEIKHSIVGHNTAIGHLSYLGDSVVGNNVNFGAGTITSNFRHDGKNHRSMVDGNLIDTGRRKFGAIIGDHVHTGIHTAIYPGRKLAANTSTRPGDIIQHDLRS
jgi:NDP-sugar pyrophosphorylase family protein